jgi:Icc protein
MRAGRYDMTIQPGLAVCDRRRNPGAAAPGQGSFFAAAALCAALLIVLLAWASTGGSQPVRAAVPPGEARPEAGKQADHHLVVLGDPHIPGKSLAVKQRVLKRIGAWSDVEGIVAVGDLCADRCTREEVAAVQAFFGGLAKPLLPIAGNHDALYEDFTDPKGKRVRASPETVARKLSRFREAFGLTAIHYHRKVGPYLLVFLSTDRPDFLAGLSAAQFAWLRGTLEENRQTPTLVFFHAPLQGTLRDYNDYANTPHFVAQPAEAIRDLLKRHPQVFLWVSGHMHITPREESFASPINLYDRRVMNIHVPDMNRKAIWTVSLFLYPDRVVVRTYDHQTGAWLKELDRTVPAPPP